MPGSGCKNGVVGSLLCEGNQLCYLSRFKRLINSLVFNTTDMNYYDNVARHGQSNLTQLLPLTLEACILANWKLFRATEPLR